MSPKLYCVHCIGPDEYSAAASEEDALIRAREFNTWSEKYRDENFPDDPVSARAEVALWPGTPEEHAAELTKQARLALK